MKAIAVKLDEGGFEPLLRRVRTGQELGFDRFDLCVCNPQVPLERIAHELSGHKVSLAALRLKEPRHSAMIFRRAGYAKLAAPEIAIAEQSLRLVLDTAGLLAVLKPKFLVLDGGFVNVPALAEKQARLDEVLDCDECDETRLNTLAEVVKISESAAEKQLDTFCRMLHRILAELEPIQVCLLPPESPFGLLTPERMAHVFSDLGTDRLGYWHSTSHVALLHKLGGPKAPEWIERFGTRLRGVYLGDLLGGQGEQVPGLGEIKFDELAGELAQNTVRVMVVDDDKGTKLRFGSDYLARVGLF